MDVAGKLSRTIRDVTTSHSQPYYLCVKVLSFCPVKIHSARQRFPFVSSANVESTVLWTQFAAFPLSCYLLSGIPIRGRLERKYSTIRWDMAVVLVLGEPLTVQAFSSRTFLRAAWPATSRSAPCPSATEHLGSLGCYRDHHKDCERLKTWQRPCNISSDDETDSKYIHDVSGCSKAVTKLSSASIKSTFSDVHEDATRGGISTPCLLLFTSWFHFICWWVCVCIEPIIRDTHISAHICRIEGNTLWRSYI